MGANFNSSAEYMGRTSNVLDMNSAYTVMGWFKYASSPAAPNVIAALNNSAGTLYDLIQHDNNVFKLSVDGVGGNGSTLSANTWYHFALVRSSTTLVTLYLDGVSDVTDTQNISGRAANTQENVGGILATYDMNGDLAYVKAWSTNLTVDEIKQEMNAIRPIKKASLHLWTPMYTGDRTADYSGNGYNWTENGAISNASPPPVSYGAENNIIPFASASSGFQPVWAKPNTAIGFM